MWGASAQHEASLVFALPGEVQDVECSAESANASALVPLQVSTGQPDSIWISDYERGRRLASIGLKLGLVGGTAAVVSFPVFIAAFAGASDVLLWGSVGLLFGGTAMTLVGAPLAAYGVGQTHRALSSAELVSGACAGCIASWVTFATTPVVAYGIGIIGIGSLFVISAVQLWQNHKIYTQHTQASLRRPTIRVAPMVHPDAHGLSLVGSF